MDGPRWSSIKRYDGVVLVRHGPLIGKASEITYDVAGECKEDGSLITLENVTPSMRGVVVAPGTEDVDIYAASPGDACKIVVIDGDIRVSIQEALYVEDCQGGL